MKVIDVLIIGGGPAGLTAAQYATRAALKTVLFEQSAFGGQALVIDTLENYPGNVERKSGSEIIERFYKQALDFGAALENGRIVSLQKTGVLFDAALENGEHMKAKAVILACGARHRLLEVPGEDRLAGRGVSYCASCDGPFFKNKKIFVAGGGDAACDEACVLARLSSDVTILVRRNELRAQKAVALRVLNHPGIRVKFNTKVAEIKGDEKVSALVLEDTQTGVRSETAAGALFILAGMVPQTELVNGSGLRAQLDPAGFIVTAQDMQSSIPGLFAAGDARSSPFHQVIVAAGEGAVAAHAAAEYISGLPS